MAIDLAIDPTMDIALMGAGMTCVMQLLGRSRQNQRL
jgi:hypothetical protein